jgi:hypothetical protein
MSLGALARPCIFNRLSIKAESLEGSERPKIGWNLKPLEEKRVAPRYRLHLAVLFKFRNHETHKEGGFTRDMSAKGLFVMSTVAPPLRTTLDLEILFPASGQIPGIAIAATGRVVRISTHGEGHGFAVETQLAHDTTANHRASVLLH